MHSIYYYIIPSVMSLLDIQPERETLLEFTVTALNIEVTPRAWTIATSWYRWRIYTSPRKITNEKNCSNIWMSLFQMKPWNENEEWCLQDCDKSCCRQECEQLRVPNWQLISLKMKLGDCLSLPTILNGHSHYLCVSRQLWNSLRDNRGRINRSKPTIYKLLSIWIQEVNESISKAIPIPSESTIGIRHHSVNDHIGPFIKENSTKSMEITLLLTVQCIIPKYKWEYRKGPLEIDTLGTFSKMCIRHQTMKKKTQVE